MWKGSTKDLYVTELICNEVTKENVLYNDRKIMTSRFKFINFKDSQVNTLTVKELKRYYSCLKINNLVMDGDSFRLIEKEPKEVIINNDLMKCVQPHELRAKYEAVAKDIKFVIVEPDELKDYYMRAMITGTCPYATLNEPYLKKDTEITKSNWLVNFHRDTVVIDLGYELQILATKPFRLSNEYNSQIRSYSIFNNFVANNIDFENVTIDGRTNIEHLFSGLWCNELDLSKLNSGKIYHAGAAFNYLNASVLDLSSLDFSELQTGLNYEPMFDRAVIKKLIAPNLKIKDTESLVRIFGLSGCKAIAVIDELILKKANIWIDKDEIEECFRGYKCNTKVTLI